MLLRISIFIEHMNADDLTILHCAVLPERCCPVPQCWLASQDEHGEEDHGAAPAGGVQPAGQRAGPHAPAPPLQ